MSYTDQWLVHYQKGYQEIVKLHGMGSDAHHAAVLVANAAMQAEYEPDKAESVLGEPELPECVYCGGDIAVAPLVAESGGPSILICTNCGKVQPKE